MGKKVDLQWIKIELARVSIADMEDGSQVRLSGIDCRVGDYLVRSPAGMSAISAEDFEAIDWLPSAPVDVPEYDMDD